MTTVHAVMYVTLLSSNLECIITNSIQCGCMKMEMVEKGISTTNANSHTHTTNSNFTIAIKLIIYSYASYDPCTCYLFVKQATLDVV